MRAAGYTFGLALVAAPLALVVAGCVEPPFSAHARDNSVDDIARALAASPSAEKGARGGGNPTAYLVTQGEKHLVAYDLADARITWDVAADVTSRVAVGRGFVAHRQGKQSIAVRAGSNGQQRCSVEMKAGEQFLGIAADTRVYYVVQTLTGATRTSTIVAISPDTCSQVWRDEASGSMGAPAARGDVVAVPYAYQNIVFLDGKSGAELARVRATDESVSFVRATAEGFFYGDNKGVYLFNSKSAAGSKKGSAYTEAHLASSQIRTFYYWDAYQPSQADYTAFDRNRLLWLGEPQGDTVAFRDNAAFLHSYRYFFAFDGKSGEIRWAYGHPRVDVVGSDDTGPAIVFAAVDGEIGALDAASGQKVWSKKTDLKVAGATFDAEGFGPGKRQLQPVTKTLGDVLSDPDARFTAVKVFAIASMTRIPGEEVTAELVRLVTKEGVSPAIARAAAEALVARKDVAAKPIYRDALAVHYDYLNDKRVHGVDALARTVAAVDDKEAAPLLASHLLDPVTPLTSLDDVVSALVQLGNKEAVASLEEFVLTYRADPSFLGDPQSLQLAADGIMKLGGPEGRRVLNFLTDEPRTLKPIASYVRRMLDGKVLPRAKVADKSKPTAPRSAVAASVHAPPPVVAKPVPAAAATPAAGRPTTEKPASP